jgi:hypothetical protein
MKISKIPGLGRFGIFVDDVDFDTISINGRSIQLVMEPVLIV